VEWGARNRFFYAIQDSRRFVFFRARKGIGLRSEGEDGKVAMSSTLSDHLEILHGNLSPAFRFDVIKFSLSKRV
jgi:hypothetical protein